MYRPTAWTTGQRTAPIRWILGCPDAAREVGVGPKTGLSIVAMVEEISNIVIF